MSPLRHLNGLVIIELTIHGPRIESSLQQKGRDAIACLQKSAFTAEKAQRGERMTKGNGWRLAVVKGRKRIFVGTLLETINMEAKRLAIFSVPK